MLTECFEISWEQSTQKDEELGRDTFILFCKWLRTDFVSEITLHCIVTVIARVPKAFLDTCSLLFQWGFFKRK